MLKLRNCRLSRKQLQKLWILYKSLVIKALACRDLDEKSVYWKAILNNLFRTLDPFVFDRGKKACISLQSETKTKKLAVVVPSIVVSDKRQDTFSILVISHNYHGFSIHHTQYYSFMKNSNDIFTKPFMPFLIYFV